MDDKVTVFGPFALTMDESGVAVARFDVEGEKQNVLRERYLADAAAMLQHLETDRSVTGLVIESGKEDSFIAGADVRMLAGCASADEASALSRSGQQLFGRLEALPIPVVAAIKGACLGGGLELVLACHARICAETETTRLALPEVKLGLLPGSGGTQRLPRLIGIQDALRLMLTGRRIGAHEARSLGVVDEVVPASILRKTAVDTALRLRNGNQRRTKRSWSEKFLETNPVGRKVIISQARKSADEKGARNYPALAAIIDCVEVGAEDGYDEGLRTESAKFGELAVTSQAQALMGLFLASNDLKPDVAREEQTDTVTSVGVLGAGLMGAGIAYVSSVNAGLDVRLKDRDFESLGGGLKYVADRLRKHAKRRRMSTFEYDATFDRITTTVDYSGFEKVDVVIEAVYEDLALKQRMIAEIEEVSAPDVIFATNTSSIPISKIAARAARPQNVIGLHYFSPVERMPLLEMVIGSETSDTAISAAFNLGKRQGKTVIAVADRPGFYVNRILAPYLNEATQLLLEGVAITDVDRALRDFGFPLGPFELMDEVGLDVGSKVVPVLEEAFGDRLRSTGVIEAMAADGRTGRKGENGFYTYDKGGKRADPDSTVNKLLDINQSKTLASSEIQNRCVCLMVNEAIYCLSESVITDPRAGDVGAVFGIGFPPFIGGPFRYVDLVRASSLVARLKAYTSDLGPRFQPAERLVEMANAGTTFYSNTIRN